MLRVSICMFKTLFIISFFLNSFLCIDLYLTVKSPFNPPQNRLKYYYWISILVGGSISVFEAVRYTGHSRTVEDGKNLEELTILGAFIIFIIIAIPATVFASRRILRKGVSESVRREVISRHIKYILILTVTFALYAWKILEEDVLNREEPQWLDQVSVYMFASQGLLLSILRLSEPLVW
jgi:hypothetical protein